MRQAERRWPAGILALALALAGAARAQGLSEEDYFGDYPVVLSAARIAQPMLYSPSSISVIDEEMIRATGARDVAELFRLLPGFQVGYVNGSKPVVTYHGLADEFARRMQVLIDGRSVYVPTFGGVPWENLPLALEDIVRIEVIRGPNAASFGPNAFSGVISISTRHTSEETGTSVSLSAGDRERRNGVLRYNRASADLDYRLTLGYERNEGFDDQIDGRRVGLLTGRLDYSINANDTLMLQAGINGADFDVGKVGRATDPVRERDGRHFFNHLRWERSYSSEESLVVQYYFNSYDVIDHFVAATRIEISPFPPVDASSTVDFDTFSERHDFEVQYNFKPAEDLRMVAGASARQDRVSSLAFFGDERWLSNHVYRLFAHTEWSLSQSLDLNAGAMLEDNDITGTDLSPKIALLYKLGRDQSVRVAASSATRTPVLFEDRPNSFFAVQTSAPPPLDQLVDFVTVPAGGLEPEEITSLEAGYRIMRAGYALDVRLFYDQLKKIVLQRRISFPADTFDGEALIFENRADATFRGIEAQLDLALSARARLVAAASYAKAGSVDDNSAQDVERSIPRWTASLLGIYRLDGRSMLSFDYNYVDDLDWMDVSSGNTTRKLDLQYLQGFRLRDQSASLAISLENVLGDYAEYRQDNVVGPGGFLRFTLDYQ